VDRLVRFFEILSHLKVGEQNAISTPNLLQLLNMGKPSLIRARTLQKDLAEMMMDNQNIFPLISINEERENDFNNRNHKKERTNRWYLEKRLQFPKMSVDEAVAFKLTEMFVDPVLPKGLSNRISDYFEMANDVLNVNGEQNWLNKFHVEIPETRDFMFSELLDSFPLIVDSLVGSFQFKAKFNGIESIFNPLYFVITLGDGILIATYQNKSEIKEFPIYGFSDIEVLTDSVVIPKGFDIDNHKSTLEK
jgi:hypothetical protein